MDIYATREELKSRQKNIFDLKLNVAYYARVSTDKEEQKTSIEHQWTFFKELDACGWLYRRRNLRYYRNPQRGIPENAPGCKSREN